MNNINYYKLMLNIVLNYCIIDMSTGNIILRVSDTAHGMKHGLKNYLNGYNHRQKTNDKPTIKTVKAVLEHGNYKVPSFFVNTKYNNIICTAE